MSLVWRFRIFTGTNVGAILVLHLLLGLVLASWSFFVAVPFGKSPQLAAVASTFLSILFAILALVLKGAGDGTVFIFSLIFPPGFYVFAIRAIAGFETHQIPTNLLHPDPDNNLRILPIFIVAIVSRLTLTALAATADCSTDRHFLVAVCCCIDGKAPLRRPQSFYFVLEMLGQEAS